ncbi:MAG: hypothetical protein ACFNM6_03595, partial [Prevotella sp.]
AFRHSLASQLLSKETPLSIISSTLGHVSTVTTSNYLRVDLTKRVIKIIFYYKCFAVFFILTTSKAVAGNNAKRSYLCNVFIMRMLQKSL